MLTWEVRTVLPRPKNQITLEVQFGNVSTVADGWRISDGFGEFVISGRTQIQSKSAGRKSITEKEGEDGSIDGSGQFVSSSIALSARDEGKKITISGSNIPTNNGKFEIQQVLPTGELVLDVVLTTDVGPLTWAILPRAEIVISGPVPPKGFIEQENDDLDVTVSAFNDSTVKSLSAVFSADDIDKKLTIRGSSAGNNGTYKITTFIDQSSVKVEATLALEVGLIWEVRTPTLVGDLTQVDIAAPSLISLLAPDFGIEIDTQENESRQRSWVRNVSQWIQLKGSEKGYEVLGDISGFDVEVVALYRITQDLAEFSIPDDHEFEVGDPDLGRVGTDGSLTFGAGRVRFSSPVAAFRESDVGRQIIIDGSGSGNNGMYTIDIFIDVNTVEFRLVDTAATPDVNNGSLSWSIVRLYTDLAPLHVLFDEIDTDLLTTIVGVTAFTVDKFCFETDFLAEVDITVIAVTSVSSTLHEVRVTGVFPGSPAVVVGVGHWKIVDFAGTSFFLESVPVEGPPTEFVFNVFATSPPVLGLGILEYVCVETEFGCDFCKSNKVLAHISEGSIALESGVAIERARDRLLSRLEQTKPVHVEIIPLFETELEAVLNIQVFIDAELEIPPPLMAPLGGP